MATSQDSMLAGLFSTPEQYQQNRLALQEAQAIKQAKLSNYERGLAGQQMGLNRLADVGAGALGIQDPMLQQLSTINQLASQFDTGTSGGMAAFANALREKQLYGPAAQLAAQVAPLRLKEAEAQAKTAERLTNEQKNATAIADSAGLQRGTSEWTDKYNTELARLTAGSKGANIKEIGVAEGTRQPVYFDVATDSQFVMGKDATGKQVRMPFTGGVDRTTAKTNIGITQKQEEAVTKSNVEAFGALRDEAINAGKTIESVQAIKPLINQAFTGFAANTKLTAGQIADTFGIPVQGTTETEKLRSIQNNLKIGNSTVLKGAISDKDMAILGEAIGQGNTTAGGIRGIIDDLEKNALISQAKYQRANKFQQEGKIAQYDFVENDKAARAEINTKLKRLRELESKAQGAK